MEKNYCDPASGLIITEKNKEWNLKKSCCEELYDFLNEVRKLKFAVEETTGKIITFYYDSPLGDFLESYSMLEDAVEETSNKIKTSYLKSNGAKKNASGEWLYECNHTCVNVTNDLKLGFDTMLDWLLTKYSNDKINV